MLLHWYSVPFSSSLDFFYGGKKEGIPRSERNQSEIGKKLPPPKFGWGEKVERSSELGKSRWNGRMLLFRTKLIPRSDEDASVGHVFLPFGKGMMIMIVVARRSHQRFWKWWMTRFSVLLPLFPPHAFRVPYFPIFLSCDLKRCDKKGARLSVKRWRFVSINCWS